MITYDPTTGEFEAFEGSVSLGTVTTALTGVNFSFAVGADDNSAEIDVDFNDGITPFVNSLPSGTVAARDAA